MAGYRWHPDSAFWLAQGYDLFYGSPASPAEFESFARTAFDALTPFSRGHDRVALSGADVSEPEAQLPGMVAQFNQKSDQPFSFASGSPRTLRLRLLRVRTGQS